MVLGTPLLPLVLEFRGVGDTGSECEYEYEVYQDGNAEPLVPTLQPFIYANRFCSKDKSFVHLYNATQHTVDGPVYAIQLQPTQHLFDPSVSK